MSTTYFKTSNIEKLTKKSRNKNKKITDKNVADEKGVKDDKLVEGFDPTNILGGSIGDSSSGSGSGSGSGNNPLSNILGSSDTSGGNGSGSGSGSGSGGGGSGSGDTTSDASPTSILETNTQQEAGKQQLDPNSIITFCLHALLSVALAYVWGFLATNVLFLAKESEKNLDYILPVDEYGEPYTKNSKKKSRWSYGFPYNLGFGRDMDATSQLDIDKEQKLVTRKMFVSQSDIKADPSGLTQKGLFPALTQYLFEAIYGGLGKGGRSLIRGLLSICAIKDKMRPTTEGTWYGDDMMVNETLNKIYFFLVWPLLLIFCSPLLLTIIGIWSAITTFVFGILQTHIIWGLIFSFTIGIFLSMGTGFYMAIQSIYVFFIYPWSNSNSDTKTKYKDIFQNLIPYMLVIFYIQIFLWGFKDLGAYGGSGIAVIIAASILMQYSKNSDGNK